MIYLRSPLGCSMLFMTCVLITMQLVYHFKINLDQKEFCTVIQCLPNPPTDLSCPYSKFMRVGFIWVGKKIFFN